MPFSLFKFVRKSNKSTSKTIPKKTRINEIKNLFAKYKANVISTPCVLFLLNLLFWLILATKLMRLSLHTTAATSIAKDIMKVDQLPKTY